MDLHANKSEFLPTEAVDIETGIYSACLFEIVRQVSVHCYERGQLLKTLFE
jgi:Axonemal dynein light chain